MPGTIGPTTLGTIWLVSEIEVKQTPLRAHLPNALTVMRLLLLPVFWVALLGSDGVSRLACALFAVASATDWLDGYLARRFRHSTRFGRLADPLADRLLINSAVILLWYHDRIGWLAPALIIGRDIVLALSIGSATRHGYELSVIYLGKTATALLMIGLAVMLATRAEWPAILFWSGLALSLVAGGVYLLTVRARKAV